MSEAEEYVERAEFYGVGDDDHEIKPDSTQVEGATPLPFALPCSVSEYQTDFVVHDARWRRIAAFPRTQEQGQERAEMVRDALNAYDSHRARVEAGLSLFRQLVSGHNALRMLDVFACNQAEHGPDCECFWEQCEAWAKADGLVANKEDGK